MLGVAAIVLVSRYSSVSWADTRALDLADVEARVLDSLAVGWRRPERLFPLLVVFQGFWWGGHLLWLLLFSVGAPLSGTATQTPAVLVVFAIVFLPLVAASVYSMAFWFQELQHRTSGRPTSVPPAKRLPDFLAAPTLVIGSYLVASRLFAIHRLAGLLAVLGVLAGLAGMWWSIRTARSRAGLPRSVVPHAVLIAFLVQAGGLALAPHLSMNPYGSSGSPPLLVLGTLGPLYFLPQVRADGVGGLSSSVASVVLVAGVAAFATGYVSVVGGLSVLNGGFLGVAAVVLAVSTVIRDVRDSV